jgi:aspartyl-tRNA(Asn)/glutamyl-tRNA(Gln) amidotransferase subunit A
MARGVRQRTLSPVELARAALEGIERTEPHLNAWCEVLADHALAQAAEREAEALRGEFRGTWHGVPIGVKDLFLTAGVPTRRGSRLYAQAVPTEDSPVVERMLRAGAVMVGKNTTPESGWKAASNSPLYGVTRNPWDTRASAGGSSSGSAAAVAAGHVPMSLGSDGGGSLRIPAAFCGIFSLKPTLGRVPTYPLSSSEHLSHAGAMTRTVADSALALDVLKGAHPQDPYSLPDDGSSWLAALESLPAGCRVALAPTLFGRHLDPQVERCVQAAFARLRELPGLRCVEADVDLPDPVDIFDRLWVARGAPYLGRPASERAQMDPGLARLVERSATLDLAGHLQALQERAAFCRRVERAFQDFDLLVTPMVQVLPFAAEADGPPDMDESPPVPWARWTPFSYPFNLTGQPAASVPCGWTESGLPVAMQVVGRRFADLLVLQLCAAWERAFDWQARKPAVHAGT